MATTQQLSLRNELVKYQTLTATHDKTSSWSGLGTAAIGLWHQIYIPSAIWGSLSITAYLALIAVMQNTTPALLYLEIFNGTSISPLLVPLPFERVVEDQVGFLTATLTAALQWYLRWLHGWAGGGSMHMQERRVSQMTRARLKPISRILW